MKKGLLQNPVVVGILALTAVVVVSLQFRKPKRGAARAQATASQNGGKDKKSDSKPSDPKAGAKGGTAATASPNNPGPVAIAGGLVDPVTGTVERADPADRSPLDVAYFNQHLAKWVESPNRDPFGYYPKPSDKAVTTTRTNASDILRVTAIWRQTGRQLAVINGMVTTEQAEIQGYKVDQIDATVVRLTGPSGPDQIFLADFDAGPAVPKRTNAPRGAITSTGPPPTKPGG